MLVHNRRVRAFGRRIPGLERVYSAAVKWFILRRGVSALDYRKARIKLHVTTREIVDLRLRPVAKEPWTVEWLEEHLHPTDVLYDIGANVGSYALIAATIGGSEVEVIAVEPGYATFASLCDNIVLNSLTDRVQPLSIVLGESRRLGTFTYSHTSAGGAVHELDAEANGAYRQRVLVYDLDGLIDGFGLPPPTLIKLDVDGAEAAVLAGARKALARPGMRSLIVEVDERLSDDVLVETSRAGLRLVRRIDERYGERLPGVWYGIFERAAETAGHGEM